MKYSAFAAIILAASAISAANAQDNSGSSVADAEAMADAAAAAEAIPEFAMEDAMEVGYDPTSNEVPFAKTYWYPRAEPADYPASSYVNEEEGEVRLMLSIDAAGAVTGCKVAQSSGFPSLDSKSCDVAMRDLPEFEPAKDDTGKAISGLYETEVYWSIRKPEFEANTEIDVAMTVNVDGSVSNCEILTLEGPLAAQFNKKKSPCDDMERRKAPYRDENGVPVPKRVRLTLRAVIEDIPDQAEQ